MKSFIIQSLALIGAVVVIVDAAFIPPLNNTTLLRSILDDEKKMSKTCSQEELGSDVKRPWERETSKCWKYFFCLAEKSLSLTRFNQSRLTKHLHQYNKLTKITHCHLNMNRTTSLRDLLETIDECTKNQL